MGANRVKILVIDVSGTHVKVLATDRIGKMRGVGWAICYQDPTNHRLSNHWVTLHQTGNCGFRACARDGCVGALHSCLITNLPSVRNTSMPSSQT